jgi:hypothetical protein
MAEATVLIAGLGMIGGWTAMALARAVGMLHLIDPDVVEDVNIGCQPYTSMYVGQDKAEALSNILTGFYTCYQVDSFPCDLTTEPPPTVMISAVDSMAGRLANVNWAWDHDIPLYIDGRIMGELAVVATAFDARSYNEYTADLPDDDEVPDIPCGQSGTAYVGMWVASRIAAVINQWCKGIMPRPLEVYHVGVGRGMAEEDIHSPE